MEEVRVPLFIAVQVPADCQPAIIILLTILRVSCPRIERRDCVLLYLCFVKIAGHETHHFGGVVGWAEGKSHALVLWAVGWGQNTVSLQGLAGDAGGECGAWESVARAEVTGWRDATVQAQFVVVECSLVGRRCVASKKWKHIRCSQTWLGLQCRGVTINFYGCCVPRSRAMKDGRSVGMSLEAKSFVCDPVLHVDRIGAGRSTTCKRSRAVL